MKWQLHARYVVPVLASVFLLLTLEPVAAQIQTNLPATTSGPGKLDLGPFASGAVLTIQVSGQVDLGNSWSTRADGSLAAPVTDTNYLYVNVGASYPTNNGGDGINHFAGGGANYDAVSVSFGLTGPQTTDTTEPTAIRFGSAVGTFNPAPTNRSDWFFVGLSNVVTVPAGGAHLYLAVSDPFYENNAGNYQVTVTQQVATPPPTRPSLSVSTSALGKLVSWPASATGFILETSPSPSQPNSWQTVTNAPAVSNNLCTVTIQSTQSSSFFRLRFVQP